MRYIILCASLTYFLILLLSPKFRVYYNDKESTNLLYRAFCCLVMVIIINIIWFPIYFILYLLGV